MCKSSHLQKPTKIPVSAWDIFKKLVSYLVRSAQSASRGACLSWLSGKLQLCSSITQTRSSILSHKLPGTGGSSVVWGSFIIFQDQFLHSWLPQLEEQVGNVLAQLFVWGGSREFSRAGWSSRGTTAGAGLGAPGASSGALGWAVFVLPRSSASADGHPSLAAQTPSPSWFQRELASFLSREDVCSQHSAVAVVVSWARTPGSLLPNGWVGICSWAGGVWNWLLGIKGSFCRPPVKFPLGLTKIFKVS